MLELGRSLAKRGDLPVDIEKLRDSLRKANEERLSADYAGRETNAEMMKKYNEAVEEATITDLSRAFTEAYMEMVWPFIEDALEWIPRHTMKRLRHQLTNVEYLSVLRTAMKAALWDLLPEDELGQKIFNPWEATNREGNILAKESIEGYLEDVDSELERIPSPEEWAKLPTEKKRRILERWAKLSTIGGSFDLNNPEIKAGLIAAERAGNRKLDYVRERLAQDYVKDYATDADLDDLYRFFDEFVFSGAKKTITLFFDNNFEGVFDLAFVQALLEANPNLTIIVVPKSVPASNDFSVADLEEVIAETPAGQYDLFGNLREFRTDKGGRRFRVITTGPGLQGVDLRHSSKEVTDAVLASDLVITKGQANAESFQGYRGKGVNIRRLHILIGKGRGIQRFTGIKSSGVQPHVIALVEPGVALGSGPLLRKTKCPVTTEDIEAASLTLQEYRVLRKFVEERPLRIREELLEEGFEGTQDELDQAVRQAMVKEVADALKEYRLEGYNPEAIVRVLEKYRKFRGSLENISLILSDEQLLEIFGIIAKGPELPEPGTGTAPASPEQPEGPEKPGPVSITVEEEGTPEVTPPFSGFTGRLMKAGLIIGLIAGLTSAAVMILASLGIIVIGSVAMMIAASVLMASGVLGVLAGIIVIVYAMARYLALSAGKTILPASPEELVIRQSEPPGSEESYSYVVFNSLRDFNAYRRTPGFISRTDQLIGDGTEKFRDREEALEYAREVYSREMVAGEKAPGRSAVIGTPADLLIKTSDGRFAVIPSVRAYREYMALSDSQAESFALHLADIYYTEDEALRRAEQVFDNMRQEQRFRSIVSARPELELLAAGMGAGLNVEIEEGLDVPYVIEDNTLRINKAVLKSEAVTLLVLRHALEMMTLNKLRGSPDEAVRLAFQIIASQVTLSYLTAIPERFETEYNDTYDSIIRDIPGMESILPLSPERMRQYKTLSDDDRPGFMAAVLGITDAKAISTAVTASPLAKPAEVLASQGGDSRLVYNRQTGKNKYGATITPRKGLISFASTTSSSASGQTYMLAELARRELLAAALEGELELKSSIENIIGRTRKTIEESLGLEGLDGLEILLTPSGTDVESLSTYFAIQMTGLPVTNIITAHGEVGSGSLLASILKHYDKVTPSGAKVTQGDPIEGCEGFDVTHETVMLRQDDTGEERTDADVKKEIEDKVRAAAENGRAVVLHVVVNSKTGLRAPDTKFARSLTGKYSNVLVVVDAAQMRFEDESLIKEYLEAGFIVNITGSKFYGGLPFSGGMLIPKAVADKLRAPDMAVPAGFGDYFSAAGITDGMPGLKKGVSQEDNLGMLIRWVTAAPLMSDYSGVKKGPRSRTRDRLVKRMTAIVGAYDGVRIARSGAPRGETNTIITFRVEIEGKYLGKIGLTLMHELLNKDISSMLPADADADEAAVAGTECYIGQPVGLNKDGSVVALRMGLSSEQVLHAMDSSGFSGVLTDTDLVMRKIALIRKYWDLFQARPVTAPAVVVEAGPRETPGEPEARATEQETKETAAVSAPGPVSTAEPEAVQKMTEAELYDRDIINTTEAAQILGISIPYLYILLEKDSSLGEKVRGRWRISRKAVLARKARLTLEKAAAEQGIDISDPEMAIIPYIKKSIEGSQTGPMINYALEKLAKVRMVPVEIAEDSAEEFFEGLRGVPRVGSILLGSHEAKILPHLAGMDADAEALGTAEMLVRDGDNFTGRMMEGEYFADWMKHDFGADVIKGKKVVILGAGVAGKAIARAFAKDNTAGSITAYDIDASRGDGMGSIQPESGTGIDFLSDADEMLDIIADADIVINVTGLIDRSPLQSGWVLKDGALAVDLNYREKSEFLKEAEAYGADIHDAHGYLYHLNAYHVAAALDQQGIAYNIEELIRLFKEYFGETQPRASPSTEAEAEPESAITPAEEEGETFIGILAKGAAYGVIAAFGVIGLGSVAILVAAVLGVITSPIIITGAIGALTAIAASTVIYMIIRKPVREEEETFGAEEEEPEPAVSETALPGIRDVLERAGLTGMKMGTIVARMGGVDGVALETKKIIEVSSGEGMPVTSFIGEGEVRSSDEFTLDPSVAFGDPANQLIISLSFMELSDAGSILKLMKQHREELGRLDKPAADRIISALEQVSGKGPADQLKALSELRDDINAIVRKLIETKSAELEQKMEGWIDSNGLRVVTLENCNTIPMQIILGVAVARIAARRSDITFINHNHDFWFERRRYAEEGRLNDVIGEYLDLAFPLAGDNVIQLFINSWAKRKLRSRWNALIHRYEEEAARLEKTGAEGAAKAEELRARAGMLKSEAGKLKDRDKSDIIPNVMDFTKAPPELDEYNSDFRSKIGVEENDILIGSVVRLIERKGIEFSLKMLKWLKEMDPANAHRYKLVLTGGDETIEGGQYKEVLESYARDLGLELGKDVIFVSDVKGVEIGQARSETEERKVYTIEDVYANIDLFSYSSTYEGFGNALLEAIQAKIPVVVFPYRVYIEDIGEHLSRGVIEYPQLNSALLERFGINVDLVTADDLQLILELASVDDPARLEMIRKLLSQKAGREISSGELDEFVKYSRKYNEAFKKKCQDIKKVTDELIKHDRPERIKVMRELRMVRSAHRAASRYFSYERLNAILAGILERTRVVREALREAGDSVGKTREFYERRAREYAQRWSEPDPNLAPHLEKLDALRPVRGKILESGAGVGREMMHFMSRGYDAYGIDYSPEMAKIASEREGLRGRVSVMDMRHLGFKDGTYDAVWDNASFVHIPEREAGGVISEYHRVLNDGGILFLRVKEGEGEVTVDTGEYEGESRFYKLYKEAELRKLLEENGFEIIEMETRKEEGTGRDVNWIHVFARKKTAMEEITAVEPDKAEMERTPQGMLRSKLTTPLKAHATDKLKLVKLIFKMLTGLFRKGTDKRRIFSLILMTLGAIRKGKSAEEMSKLYLKGGYEQPGYGVPEGASIDGSHAVGGEGTQGYYVGRTEDGRSGKQVYIDTVRSMRDFFERRRTRNGKPVRYIIKTGIGGQHTPFQGICDSFNAQVVDLSTGKVVFEGEYELGKDFEEDMSRILSETGAGWDQVAVIPSSKSGSTDETMMVFVEIMNVLIKKLSAEAVRGIDGEKFAGVVLDTLHEINFRDGKEIAGKDLFKDFSLDLIVERAVAAGLDVNRDQVKAIFGKVLGNMFFETTDRPSASRLSAFIRNSGLDKELGEDAPGFGAMFDNVGGRWTADLHMMVFLAYYGLDAQEYWDIRYKGIKSVRDGSHIANNIGDRIVDEGITDIALVVPDELFWFAKSIEQNFNESIWQDGYANLKAVRQSDWDAQSHHYKDRAGRLVINLSGIQMAPESYNLARGVQVPGDIKGMSGQDIANMFAGLNTLFYGVTNTVANRLIARALAEAGLSADDVDLNDLDNPATKIVQENLFLRQPYVELGKGLLEKRLKGLQAEEAAGPGAIKRAMDEIKGLARKGTLSTNVEGLDIPGNVTDVKELAEVIRAAAEYARKNGRIFVPFIYLEGERFYQLRDHLIDMGIEWVLQGTGDQHISYQQVLAQPKKYLPFVISFVPENEIPGKPAIGFAKGYLDNVSPHMVRDYFAQASYEALTDLRAAQGGEGIFLRLTDSDDNINMLKRAAPKVETTTDVLESVTEAAPARASPDKTTLEAVRKYKGIFSRIGIARVDYQSDIAGMRAGFTEEKAYIDRIDTIQKIIETIEKATSIPLSEEIRYTILKSLLGKEDIKDITARIKGILDLTSYINEHKSINIDGETVLDMILTDVVVDTHIIIDGNVEYVLNAEENKGKVIFFLDFNPENVPRGIKVFSTAAGLEKYLETHPGETVAVVFDHHNELYGKDQTTTATTLVDPRILNHLRKTSGRELLIVRNHHDTDSIYSEVKLRGYLPNGLDKLADSASVYGDYTPESGYEEEARRIHYTVTMRKRAMYEGYSARNIIVDAARIAVDDEINNELYGEILEEINEQEEFIDVFIQREHAGVPPRVLMIYDEGEKPLENRYSDGRLNEEVLFNYLRRKYDGVRILLILRQDIGEGKSRYSIYVADNDNKPYDLTVLAEMLNEEEGITDTWGGREFAMGCRKGTRLDPHRIREIAEEFVRAEDEKAALRYGAEPAQTVPEVLQAAVVRLVAEVENRIEDGAVQTVNEKSEIIIRIANAVLGYIDSVGIDELDKQEYAEFIRRLYGVTVSGSTRDILRASLSWVEVTIRTRFNSLDAASLFIDIHREVYSAYTSPDKVESLSEAAGELSSETEQRYIQLMLAYCRGMTPEDVEKDFYQLLSGDDFEAFTQALQYSELIADERPSELEETPGLHLLFSLFSDYFAYDPAAGKFVRINRKNLPVVRLDGFYALRSNFVRNVGRVDLGRADSFTVNGSVNLTDHDRKVIVIGDVAITNSSNSNGVNLRIAMGVPAGQDVILNNVKVTIQSPESVEMKPGIDELDVPELGMEGVNGITIEYAAPFDRYDPASGMITIRGEVWDIAAGLYRTSPKQAQDVMRAAIASAKSMSLADASEDDIKRSYADSLDSHMSYPEMAAMPIWFEMLSIGAVYNGRFLNGLYNRYLINRYVNRRFEGYSPETIKGIKRGVMEANRVYQQSRGQKQIVEIQTSAGYMQAEEIRRVLESDTAVGKLSRLLGRIGLGSIAAPLLAMSLAAKTFSGDPIVTSAYAIGNEVDSVGAVIIRHFGNLFRRKQVIQIAPSLRILEAIQGAT
ncbi:MAG: DUF89 family protein [Elusimicrobia bacterium]|nr:DUF89 family protein [Elusimicrobiota bacterium]